MKKAFVKTRDVKSFVNAMSRLQNARPGIPKMALLYGKFGVGRTETAIWWAAQHEDAKFVRIVSLMEGPWLLSTIIAELGHVAERTIARRFQQCVDVLLSKPHVLIFDEIDYITGNQKAIEILRDLHDVAGTIIVFVGMENAEAKLKRFPHLNDRIVERIKFDELSFEDVRFAATELCEVELADDCIPLLHKEGARFRPLIKSLYRCESLARANSLKRISAADFNGGKK